MAIPALSTADKLFICSYNIGSNIDHRKVLGNINEITTFTNEYIDGFCWIPVNATITDNNHSWWWDLPDKDQVYVKVGVRVSADGYIHAWLLDTQTVSELILWNNNYNTTNQPIDDTTILHLCIEKMYQVIFDNTTGFISSNIKFQKYGVGSATHLYLFGQYSNSLTNHLTYTIDHPTNVQKSSWSWYPNNSTTNLSDYLYSSLHGWAKQCTKADIDANGWIDFGSAFGKDPEHADPLFYWHEIGVAGSVNIPSVCNPTDPIEKTFNHCHITYELSGFATGNNSGRSYPLYEGFPGVACTGKGYTDCGSSISEQQLRIDYTGNRAYIEDPPGVYSCDSSFTYDSSASFTTGQWRLISADEIGYGDGLVKFSGHSTGTHFLAVYWTGGIFDDFLEYSANALDELKHGDFTIALTGSQTNRMLSIWTKHIAIGLLTNAVPTISNADWIINWGVNNYFSNWQTPDGLATRTPTVTNTPYIRPITHHDEFNVVTNEPVLGGFLYDLQTSNGFLERNPGTETKIEYSISNQADFSFLYKLLRPIIADLYHLELTGDDTKDGKSWDEAWKSWTHAMQNTPDERTLLVEEGIYNIGETQIEPDNSIVIYLVKNHIDDVSTVTVTI